MPDLDPETWDVIDRRIKAMRRKLDEISGYSKERAYGPLHAALEKLGESAQSLAETVVHDVLGQIHQDMHPTPQPIGELPPQVIISSAQLGVLSFVHEADLPVETGPYSNFTAGWVSGSVASALVTKGLLRYTASGRVEVTPAGCAALAQYVE